MLTDDAAYSVIGELKPGVSWVAADATGRRVVLKLLPPDCLRQGQLHPAVRDRLARFRELPLINFAALIGVERVGGQVVTVSTFIDGVTLDESPPAQRRRHLRALRHTIAALHHLGLVHGQLHSRNMLIDPLGALHVIDPSPLLHDDPADDRAALDLLDPPEHSAAPIRSTEQEQPLRQRTVLTAVLLAVAGAIVAAVLVLVFWSRA